MKNSFKITYAYRVINPTFLWRNNKRRPFFITVSHSISISNASLRRARSFSTTRFIVLVCFTHLHSQNGLKIISIKKNEKKTKKSQKFFFFSSFRAKKPIVHSEHTGYHLLQKNQDNEEHSSSSATSSSDIEIENVFAFG